MPQPASTAITQGPSIELTTLVRASIDSLRPSRSFLNGSSAGTTKSRGWMRMVMIFAVRSLRAHLIPSCQPRAPSEGAT